MGNIQAESEKRPSPGADNHELTLVPARPDFKSPQLQMNATALVSLILCLLFYLPALHAPFSAVDLAGLSNVLAATKGNWQPFFQGMVTFGSEQLPPLPALSLLVDASLGRMTPEFFHVCNVILYFACAYLTGLISLEISGLKGNRLIGTAAVWSALLFAACPFSVDALLRTAGRVDLLNLCFCLYSIFAYLRFRLIRVRAYYKWSLTAFAAALLCNNSSLMVPPVILAAELLLFQRESSAVSQATRDNRLVQRTAFVMSYFFVLCFIYGAKLMLPGIVVTASDVQHLFYLQGAHDHESLLKVFNPMSAVSSEQRFLPVLCCGYIAACISLISRLFLRTELSSTIMFLCSWMLLAFFAGEKLPVGENLIGSHFFLPVVAPACILISAAALPAVDKIARKYVMPLVVCGCVALSCIFMSWSAVSLWLVHNCSMGTSLPTDSSDSAKP